MNLAEIQSTFWQCVRTEPGPDEQDVVFSASPTLSARDCMAIYRRMYWYRQVDALFEVFPLTAELLGPEAFTRACSAYIARFPSEAPAIELQGRQFAPFLLEAHFDAAALARVEWAKLEAIVAKPNPRPLGIDDLYNSERRWVRLAPSARLVSTPASVAARFVAVNGAADVMLIVYRDGFVVRTADVSPMTLDAHELLRRGALLAEVCATLASHPLPVANQTVGQWIASQLVEVADAPE